MCLFCIQIEYFSFLYLSGESSICEANIVPIYECFLLALEDYTHDRRGDIGAWVREASMSGLTSLTLLASKESSLVPQICVEAMMPKIGKFIFEKKNSWKRVMFYKNESVCELERM